MAGCIKSTADNSSAVAPQKILTFRDTEMLFYAFSWRCFQKRKVLEKIKRRRILWVHKDFFHVKMA